MKWLEVALDAGISERDFWVMTFAELERELLARQRQKKREAQERASYNYILGDLIGRSIARIYSSSAKYPKISEVYPTLFDSQEIIEKKQEQKNKLSALRFKQFAQSYNNRFNKVVAKDNDE